MAVRAVGISVVAASQGVSEVNCTACYGDGHSVCLGRVQSSPEAAEPDSVLREAAASALELPVCFYISNVIHFL